MTSEWDTCEPEQVISPSIRDRARARLKLVLPFETGNLEWELPGLKEFGDSYPSYNLSTAGEGTWYCSCYDHFKGEVREKHVCSHSVAVALHTGLPCEKTLALKKVPTKIPLPSFLGLPEKFREWRPYQWETIQRIVNSKKYAFLLDSPTGCGKSLIAVACSKLLNRKTVILVGTKDLQDQYLRDFPEMVSLKGRNNFPCTKLKNLWPQITAEHCLSTSKSPCTLKWSCPYEVQKKAAFSAPLVVSNYSYWLTEANYVGGLSGVPFLVLDELDMAESFLLSFISLTISQKQLSRLGLEAPRYKTKFESWKDWALPTITKVKENIDELDMELQDENRWGTAEIEALRRVKALESLYSKLKFFVKEVNENWIWYPDEEQGKWEFKPVWVSRYAPASLWDHAVRVLGMSATILDPKQLDRNLNLKANGKEYEYHALPSLFPKESRAIYYNPVADVTFKNKESAYPLLVQELEKILSKHHDVKILIHCVSYDLAYYVRDHLVNKRIIWHETKDRASKLEEFKNSQEPLVLLSPSMERGIDLPGDLCRVIVVLKTMYPNLSDPQVSKRLHGSKDGNSWYLHKTLQNLIQSTGRSTRSSQDWSISYILDKQFETLKERTKDILPKWWLEALVT